MGIDLSERFPRRPIVNGCVGFSVEGVGCSVEGEVVACQRARADDALGECAVVIISLYCTLLGRETVVAEGFDWSAGALYGVPRATMWLMLFRFGCFGCLLSVIKQKLSVLSRVLSRC